MEDDFYFYIKLFCRFQRMVQRGCFVEGKKERSTTDLALLAVEKVKGKFLFFVSRAKVDNPHLLYCPRPPRNFPRWCVWKEKRMSALTST